MIKRILHHEWRTLAADRTVWLMIALFGLIVGFGLYNGVAWVRFQEETLAAASQDQDQRLAELLDEAARVDSGTPIPGPYNHPRSPGCVGGTRGQRFALAPPASLAAMSVGQADLYPYYYKMSNRSKQTFINSDEIENPDESLDRTVRPRIRGRLSVPLADPCALLQHDLGRARARNAALAQLPQFRGSA